jgi:hypothetical protein
MPARAHSIATPPGFSWRTEHHTILNTLPLVLSIEFAFLLSPFVLRVIRLPEKKWTPLLRRIICITHNMKSQPKKIEEH